MTRLDDSIADLLAVDGALESRSVDLDSGWCLAAGGNPGFDPRSCRGQLEHAPPVAHHERAFGYRRRA